MIKISDKMGFRSEKQQTPKHHQKNKLLYG